MAATIEHDGTFLPARKGAGDGIARTHPDDRLDEDKTPLAIGPERCAEAANATSRSRGPRLDPIADGMNLP
ncbi:MAG: hypothetical protein AAB252_02260 [Pseudomonadota bacterium]